MHMWLRLYWLHNLSDHGEKQETWALKTVCKECESVEVWTRTMQYAWTYVMSYGNSLSQNPGTSFHWYPGNQDRGVRWLSVLGMNESQLMVTVASLSQAPPQWLAQVCSLYVHSSNCHRNYSCYFQSIIIQLWRSRAWQKVVVHSKAALFSFADQPILTLGKPSLLSRSLVYHHGHLNCAMGIV